MRPIHRHHTVRSAFQRLKHLVKTIGLVAIVSICLAEIEDTYLRIFDRRYRTKTSGCISLRTTSFDPAKLGNASGYRPVNAWAFRRFLKRLALPKTRRFADLGCGLGRACIIAAEYGFKKVVGVELAADLCAVARRNVSRCRSRDPSLSPMEIIHCDALDYCRQTEDDVFFMYAPFSQEFFRKVLAELSERAVRLNRILTVIHSENVSLPRSYVAGFSDVPGFRQVSEAVILGFSFHVYQCGGASKDEANRTHGHPCRPNAATQL